MCAGVVPQQPPTMLTSPDVANSRMIAAICSGVSSYSPNAFGRPAFGCALMRQSAICASASMYARSSVAPSAQLSPIAIGRAWCTEW